METRLALEPNLLKNDTLFQACYLPEREISWYLLGENPATRNIDEYIPTDARTVLERFPEMRELLESPPPDRRVMLQKGRTSGRWIDFHIK